MNPWLLTLLALLPPLLAPLALAMRGAVGQRLVAVQMMGSVATLILAVMTFAFDQASSIDLALAFAVLTLPATLLFAVYLERWL
ncbi:MAG TPA: monovalent cation/H+ antiporter complex subunit F [Lichenihabitans sp.]|jgi:multicomponent Na+:H+ antiporter subunit F|nr:monovalent cation/H+ antiporter complex subunit F [Lichenihabitans sp.]